MLIVLVPHLATRSWTKAAGIAWVLAAVAIATYSPFALLSVVAAGIVLALHPRTMAPFASPRPLSSSRSRAHGPCGDAYVQFTGAPRLLESKDAFIQSA